jgi:hypothetical protein
MQKIFCTPNYRYFGNYWRICIYELYLPSNFFKFIMESSSLAYFLKLFCWFCRNIWDATLNCFTDMDGTIVNVNSDQTLNLQFIDQKLKCSHK